MSLQAACGCARDRRPITTDSRFACPVHIYNACDTGSDAPCQLRFHACRVPLCI